MNITFHRGQYHFAGIGQIICIDLGAQGVKRSFHRFCCQHDLREECSGCAKIFTNYMHPLDQGISGYLRRCMSLFKSSKCQRRRSFFFTGHDCLAKFGKNIAARYCWCTASCNVLFHIVFTVFYTLTVRTSDNFGSGSHRLYFFRTRINNWCIKTAGQCHQIEGRIDIFTSRQAKRHIAESHRCRITKFFPILLQCPQCFPRSLTIRSCCQDQRIQHEIAIAQSCGFTLSNQAFGYDESFLCCSWQPFFLQGKNQHRRAVFFCQGKNLFFYTRFVTDGINQCSAREIAQTSLNNRRVSTVDRKRSCNQHGQSFHDILH